MSELAFSIFKNVYINICLSGYLCLCVCVDAAGLLSRHTWIYVVHKLINDQIIKYWLHLSRQTKANAAELVNFFSVTLKSDERRQQFHNIRKRWQCAIAKMMATKYSNVLTLMCAWMDEANSNDGTNNN